LILNFYCIFLINFEAFLEFANRALINTNSSISLRFLLLLPKLNLWRYLYRFRRSSRFGIEAGAYDQRLIYPIISNPTESQ